MTRLNRKARPGDKQFKGEGHERDTTVGPARSASCDKWVFDSRYRAKQYAKSRKWMGLTPYQCDDCGLWHTTSEDMASKEYHRSEARPDMEVTTVGVFKEDDLPEWLIQHHKEFGN